VLLELTSTVLHKKREVTSSIVEFIPRDQWFLGEAGSIEATPTIFSLVTSVTVGTNSEEQISEYLEKVFSNLERIVGAIHPESYIHVQGIKSADWGYGGVTQQQRGNPQQKIAEQARAEI
jgi:4-oxalocrotonate tautomerase